MCHWCGTREVAMSEHIGRRFFGQHWLLSAAARPPNAVWPKIQWLSAFSCQLRQRFQPVDFESVGERTHATWVFILYDSNFTKSSVSTQERRPCREIFSTAAVRRERAVPPIVSAYAVVMLAPAADGSRDAGVFSRGLGGCLPRARPGGAARIPPAPPRCEHAPPPGQRSCAGGPGKAPHRGQWSGAGTAP